jgi:hypothetical protein
MLKALGEQLSTLPMMPVGFPTTYTQPLFNAIIGFVLFLVFFNIPFMALGQN